MTLSREQSQAYKQYLQCRGAAVTKDNLAQVLKKNMPLLLTGFVAASSEPFDLTKIPRENHWSWNQNNGKVCIRVDSESIVTFRKVSPRRRFSDQNSPSYKIWIFHTQSSTNPDDYFLLCEKGADINLPTWSVKHITSGIRTEIGIVHPEQLTVEQFDFLKPFISPRCAQEFGW